MPVDHLLAMSIQYFAAVVVAALLMSSCITSTEAQDDNCPQYGKWRAVMKAFSMFGGRVSNLISSGSTAKGISHMICMVKQCKDMGEMSTPERESCAFKLAAEAMTCMKAGLSPEASNDNSRLGSYRLRLLNRLVKPVNSNRPIRVNVNRMRYQTMTRLGWERKQDGVIRTLQTKIVSDVYNYILMQFQ